MSENNKQDDDNRPEIMKSGKYVIAGTLGGFFALAALAVASAKINRAKGSGVKGPRP